MSRAASDARHKTRVRREQRATVEIEVPVGERVKRECPECGEAFEILVAGADDESGYGNCWNWDCDAFHAYRLQERESSSAGSGPSQTALGRFAGGELA